MYNVLQQMWLLLHYICAFNLSLPDFQIPFTVGVAMLLAGGVAVFLAVGVAVLLVVGVAVLLVVGVAVLLVVGVAVLLAGGVLDVRPAPLTATTLMV